MLLQDIDIDMRSKNDKRCRIRGRALLKTFPERGSTTTPLIRPFKPVKSFPDGVAWTIMNTINAICGPVLANAFVKGFNDSSGTDGANGFRRVPTFVWGKV